MLLYIRTDRDRYLADYDILITISYKALVKHEGSLFCFAMRKTLKRTFKHWNIQCFFFKCHDLKI